jgi:hypothetical protein
MLWEAGAFSNLRLLGVVAFSAALQLAMPVAQAVFGLRVVDRKHPGLDPDQT